MATTVRAGGFSISGGLTCLPLTLALLSATLPMLTGTAQAQAITGHGTGHGASRQAGALSPAGETLSYQVRPGDNLYTLARRYLVQPDNWRVLQRVNRIADPHIIPKGKILSIPTHLLKSDRLTARTIAFRGTATLIAADGRATPLAVNLPVTPGMAIETGNSSFVTLELSNGSRITLPSQSRLRVTHMRRIHLGDTLDFNFFLEKGRLETGVTPLKNSNGRYRIQTPVAVSAVRGTTYRVAYEGPDAPSLTEVIDGSVSVGHHQGGSAQQIEKGFGASLKADGAFAQEALLPAPELLRPGRVQADPQALFTLAPMEGAARYHAQLARDASFTDIEYESYSDTPDLMFTGIENGRWFVRLTAISASGLEGMPVNYSVRRVLAGISATSQRGDDGGYRFRWSGDGAGNGERQRLYHFHLRPDQPGAIPLINEVGLNEQLLTISDLPPGTYVWRVGVQQFENGENVTNWAPEQKLIIAAEENSNQAGRN